MGAGGGEVGLAVGLGVCCSGGLVAAGDVSLFFFVVPAAALFTVVLPGVPLFDVCAVVTVVEAPDFEVTLVEDVVSVVFPDVSTKASVALPQADREMMTQNRIIRGNLLNIIFTSFFKFPFCPCKKNFSCYNRHIKYVFPFYTVFLQM